MREIKFRAWDKKEKRMITNPNEGVKIYLNGSISDKKGWANVDLTLMQYTGLHDKRGKEIYEGDIIKTSSENSSKSVLKGTFEVIYFCDGFKMSWEIYDEKMYKNLGEFPNGNTEIIGNKWENPELI